MIWGPPQFDSTTLGAPHFKHPILFHLIWTAPSYVQYVHTGTVLCWVNDLIWRHHWIYMAGPLNILCWGSESWNLSEQNREKLNAFHHMAIRQILGIWMDEVIECHIMNEQVRKWFCNIPKVNSFITRRTWKYMGKVFRTRGESLLKKMLGAWVSATRKAGRLQMSCKDNFICTLKEVLNSQISNEATFKEWFPIAADKANGTHWLRATSKNYAWKTYTLMIPKIMSMNPLIVWGPPRIMHTFDNKHPKTEGSAENPQNNHSGP